MDDPGPHAILDKIDAALRDGELELDAVVSAWTLHGGLAEERRALAEASRLTVGEMVPGTRFEIVRWIGEGGMGQVFEARHVDIQRAVAFKVLKSNLGIAPRLSAAFLAEARACAGIESRFVVQVFDFGELPDGRPFFTMELLQRHSLHEALAEGPMPFTRALPILRQCCKGLAAIHDADLVHRDLKPGNVMLETEEGRADIVRIVDFGIAAKLGSTPEIAGTPPYMAPEQIEGRVCDARTDIYSLGCLAYRMLTGHGPFVGDNAEVLEGQLKAEAPPASSRAAKLPRQLDAILARCLAKDPEQRWPNAQELEAALCEVQISIGLVIPWELPVPEVDPARRAKLAASMPRPHRARWRSGVAVAVALGGLIGGALVAKLSESDDAAPLALAATPDTPGLERIEELTAATRAAAAKAYWVYPPSEKPEQRTALHWIRQLETETSPQADQARARADELRADIADTLVRFGDRYWDLDNGRPFALEFYTVALIFVPDHPRAMAQSPLTPTQLADIRSRAVRGEFSPAELRSAKVMQALAETDTSRRNERVRSLLEAPNSRLSTRTGEGLTELVDADGSPAEDGADSEELATSESGSEPETQAGTETGAETGAEVEVTRDPAKAQALVGDARAALARNDRSRAQRLLNEAIANDNRATAALVELAQLHFDAGEYRKALGYARKASKLQPQDNELHILVGDCYLKVLRYAEAKAAYEKAARGGHPRAEQRLAHLASLTN